MAAGLQLYRHLLPFATLITVALCSGCGASFYKTQLSADQKAVICGYGVPWDREECLEQANQQIEWCKEALGQEDDCWNTLLGDFSRYRRSYRVTDAQYFEYLHDPLTIKPLMAKIKSDHRQP